MIIKIALFVFIFLVVALITYLIRSFYRHVDRRLKSYRTDKDNMQEFLKWLKETKPETPSPKAPQHYARYRETKNES